MTRGTTEAHRTKSIFRPMTDLVRWFVGRPPTLHSGGFGALTFEVFAPTDALGLLPAAGFAAFGAAAFGAILIFARMDPSINLACVGRGSAVEFPSLLPELRSG